MKIIKKLLKDTSGHVAVIFGLSIIPIIAVAGFSIDFSATTTSKTKIQYVVDSAVLTGARAMQTGKNQAEIRTIVDGYIAAQLSESANSGMLSCGSPVYGFPANSQDITIDLECVQKTALMKVVGKKNVKLKVSSTSTWGIGKLDVAFMFDVSGSMGGSRMRNLKTSAKEAIKVLLPVDAAPEIIEDTRVAMVSYNSMVNAGDFFEDATGVKPTRTYTHIINADAGDSLTQTEGSLFSEMDIGLYDGDNNDLISRLGDGAVIQVEDNEIDDLTVAAWLNPGNSLRGRVGSMYMELRGEHTRNQTENYEPYALYGDSSGNYNSARFKYGDYTIRIRAYSRSHRNGSVLFDETLSFTLTDGEVPEPEEKTYTLTSTCVWERDGAEAFTADKPELISTSPKMDSFLAHRQAWFTEDEDHNDGGYWTVGHPERPNNNSYRGNECRNHKPVELTNNRTTLNTYIDSLTTGGGTAGHLGVAWSWYLIAEEWNTIFTGDAKPLDYTEPDSTKAVILMTDGEFNREIYETAQGDSDAQARAMCDAMKLKDIKVYAVALQAPTAGQRVLEYCASGPEFFFDAQNGAELTEAYRQIAVSISDLRISS